MFRTSEEGQKRSFNFGAEKPQLIIETGFRSRAGYNGVHTVNYVGVRVVLSESFLFLPCKLEYQVHHHPWYAKSNNTVEVLILDHSILD